MVRYPWLFRLDLAQRTPVLDHAENEINVLRGGITTVDGGRKNARIVLLAGAGEVASFNKKLLTRADDCSRSHSDHGKHLQRFH